MCWLAVTLKSQIDQIVCHPESNYVIRWTINFTMSYMTWTECTCRYTYMTVVRVVLIDLCKSDDLIDWVGSWVLDRRSFDSSELVQPTGIRCFFFFFLFQTLNYFSFCSKHQAKSQTRTGDHTSSSRLLRYQCWRIALDRWPKKADHSRTFRPKAIIVAKLEKPAAGIVQLI